MPDGAKPKKMSPFIVSCVFAVPLLLAIGMAVHLSGDGAQGAPTRENLVKVTDGMTPGEVERILGPASVKITPGNYQTAVYSWATGNIRIEFEPDGNNVYRMNKKKSDLHPPPKVNGS